METGRVQDGRGTPKAAPISLAVFQVSLGLEQGSLKDPFCNHLKHVACPTKNGYHHLQAGSGVIISAWLRVQVTLLELVGVPGCFEEHTAAISILRGSWSKASAALASPDAPGSRAGHGPVAFF